ncbi:hypothetical protein FPY71_15135 [Aureimonas fodinaquatilis]|uniref:Porin family protein n=1 Tax=Aureimonas fodinaquatilis TaxID=2565783 RepID=A0A5B0DUL7_9HYPH|nr:hypothetical protein [Aureimonas fodinaquatilis]KAA0968899.1 hypothetical protein FPY71_15135 [Aureimonas fodinaquatilis]
MKAWFVGIPLGLASLGSAMAADAVVPVSPAAYSMEQEGWQFTIAPYFWVAGLDGKMAQFGSAEVEVHESFSDIIKDFDIGFMSIAEARRGNFSIFNDLQYSQVSTDSVTPRGFVAGSVAVTSTTFSGLLGAGYTVAKSQDGHLDLAAGVRVWSVDTDITFYGGLLDGRSFSDGDTWADGLVGIRGNFNFTPKLYLTGWGLIGAGQADLDWDVAAALGYHFNERFSSVLGYRALGVDFSNDDGFVFDIIQHGPIVGLVVHF